MLSIGMSLAQAKIPSDPAALHAFVTALQAELYAKTLLIEKIKAQLTALRRARFGRSSEKLDRDIEQLELMLGDLEEGDAESKVRIPIVPATYSDHYPATVTDCKSGLLTAVSRQV